MVQEKRVSRVQAAKCARFIYANLERPRTYNELMDMYIENTRRHYNRRIAASHALRFSAGMRTLLEFGRVVSDDSGGETVYQRVA